MAPPLFPPPDPPSGLGLTKSFVHKGEPREPDPTDGLPGTGQDGAGLERETDDVDQALAVPVGFSIDDLAEAGIEGPNKKSAVNKAIFNEVEKRFRTPLTLELLKATQNKPMTVKLKNIK